MLVIKVNSVLTLRSVWAACEHRMGLLLLLEQLLRPMQQRHRRDIGWLSFATHPMSQIQIQSLDFGLLCIALAAGRGQTLRDFAHIVEPRLCACGLLRIRIRTIFSVRAARALIIRQPSVAA
jgi:hypothetical protein